MEKATWHLRGVRITFEAETKEQLSIEAIKELCSAIVEINDFVEVDKEYINK